METPSKTVLLANGIIPSFETKELYCSLCTFSPRPGNWQCHIKSPVHRRFMQRFNRIYKNCKTNLSCKICQETLNWDQLKNHAIQHKCYPWYMSEDINEVFFKYDILRLPRCYYCMPCKLAFPEWFEALDHIEEAAHLKTHKARSSPCQNLLTTATNISYASLVSDGFGFWSNNSLSCNICSCNNIALVNVREHITGMRHSSLKLKLTLKLNKMFGYPCDNNMEVDKENAVGQIHHHSIERNKKKCPNTGTLKKNQVKTSKKKSRVGKQRSNKQWWLNLDLSNMMQRIQELNETCYENCSCTICHFVGKNCYELHGHVAGHVAMDLASSKDNEITFDCTYKNVLRFPKRSMDEAKQSCNEIPFGTLVRHDLANDYIYDMKEKLRVLELGLKSCIGTSSELLYCFICDNDKLKPNYFEHLSSREHSIHQEIMEKDHKLFAEYPNECSVQSLSLEYIRASSSVNFWCIVCSKEIMEDLLRDHIKTKSHAENRDNKRALVMQNWESIKQRFQCNWYNVNNYLCIPCAKKFHLEVNFMGHLVSKEHKRQSKCNSKIDLIFDFCEVCACLWYGYRQTYSYHCTTNIHSWLLKDGFYAVPVLPLEAKELLAKPDEWIDNVILRCEKKQAEDRIVLLDIEKAVQAMHGKINVCEKKQAGDKTLLLDIENAVRAMDGKITVRAFDPRMTGVETHDSDVNVFVDFGYRYNEQSSVDDNISCMNDLADCLKEYPENWDVERLSKGSIIRIHHSSTGLTCDITSDRSLAFIKCYCDMYSPFQKMSIFLQEWMKLCNLSSDSRMTNRILFWQIVFYLQHLWMLPCVRLLRKMKMSPDTFVDWEAKVNRVFGSLEENHKVDIKKLLEGFFRFWAKFDYRCDVACPIMGKIMKKQDFTDLGKMSEQTLTTDFLDTTKLLNLGAVDIPRMGNPLRDYPLGIQDPFNLQCNIAKDLTKVWIKRFRTLALMSLNVLENVTMATIQDMFENSVRVLPDQP